MHHYGGHKGSVFAYEEEIDSWLAGLAEGHGRVSEQTDETLEISRRRSKELSLTADSMWETRSVGNIQTIADLYRQAIDHDPGNAPALIGLANAMVFCVLNDAMDGAISYPRAMEALRRIPQTETDRLEAKCPAAWIDLLYNRNWRQARAGFEEVVCRNPSSFALGGLAAVHVAEGRLKEALELAWEAWKRNPLASSLGAFLCWIVYLSGDFEQALDLVAQIRTGGGDGNLITTVEALVLVQDGYLEANLARLEKAATELSNLHTLQGILAYACGVAGDEGRARGILTRLSHSCEANHKAGGYGMALAAMGLNEKEQAISRLEASYSEGTLWSLGLRSDPLLRRFRGEPRFERLVSRIGAQTPYHAAADYRTRVAGPIFESALIADHH